MRIIRFIGEDGRTHFGKPLDDGRSSVLDGELFGGLTDSGREVGVKQLLAPLVPSNIFCIGLNYRQHAAETGADTPQHPVVFMKPTSALNGPELPIRVPASQMRGPEVDYECELAVIVGKPCRDVSEAEALSFVFGYTCGNDVSARRWQKEGGGGQWIRGKSFDTFCCLGPAIVTADEIPDPQTLKLSTTLNSRVMQDNSTADMIFSVAQIISFLSRDTTLLPGTVILTGTPEGVGFARKPPVWLTPGDTVTVEIERIGKLTNPVSGAAA